MARTSLRKRQSVSYNEDDNDDEMPKVTKAIAAAGKAMNKTKGAVAKAVTKRKAEPDPEPEIDAPAPAAKVTKKRKTKKEEDSTPLADRTAVSSLKPAMHIGAHVSAAGGSQSDSVSARFIR